MARVLIVGCGYLGSALGVRLAATGNVVWGLRRDPSKLPLNVNPVEGDVTIPNTFRRIPDVDVVLYLVRPDREDPETLRSVLSVGPHYLIEAFRAKRLRPKRFFFGSSVAAFGNRGGEWVDEDSEPGEGSPAGDALLAGEKAVTDAKVPSTILRFGEIYGPDRPGLVALLQPGAEPLEAPRAHTNLIHRHDAVEATLHLMNHKRAQGMYVVADREPVPRLEVLAWLAERRGVALPTVQGTEARGAGSDVRAMSERLVESGFVFTHPSFREGYRRLVARS